MFLQAHEGARRVAEIQQSEHFLKGRVDELESSEHALRTALQQTQALALQRERKLHDQVRGLLVCYMGLSKL